MGELSEADGNRVARVHYWVDASAAGALTLAFLPGLTADRRLFGKRVELLSLLDG